MSFKVVMITDDMNCETCGSSYAEGYKIYHDGELIFDKTPVAACFDGSDYSGHDPYSDILEQLGIHVEVDHEYIGTYRLDIDADSYYENDEEECEDE